MTTQQKRARIRMMAFICTKWLSTQRRVCGKKPGSRSSLPLLDFFLSLVQIQNKCEKESVCGCKYEKWTHRSLQQQHRQRRLTTRDESLAYQAYKNSHFFLFTAPNYSRDVHKLFSIKTETHMVKWGKERAPRAKKTHSTHFQAPQMAKWNLSETHSSCFFSHIRASRFVARGSASSMKCELTRL